MVIPICLASDKNYLQHLSVTMASILANRGANDAIRFYILENTFTDDDRQLLNQLKSIADFEIIYIQVKDQILELCPLHKNDRLRIEAYFRLFIPELIPNEDKILYLDCDIVVQHSLAELYVMEMEDYYVFGIRDISSRKHKKRLNTPRYINTGVMLINNKKMKEDCIHEKFTEYIINNQNSILLHDQDVVGAVLKDRIKYISDIWNAQIDSLVIRQMHSRLDNAVILHYVGNKKPWLPYRKSTLAKKYFEYLKLTPFADFEKIYKKHRAFWWLSRVPVFLFWLIYQRKNSNQETYRKIRIFGIPFKIKRKPK